MAGRVFVRHTLLLSRWSFLDVRWEYFGLCLLLGCSLFFFALARCSRSSFRLFGFFFVELSLFRGFLAFSLHCVQNESTIVFMVAVAKLCFPTSRGCPYILSRFSLSSHHWQLLPFRLCFRHLVLGHASQWGLIERHLRQQLWFRSRVQEDSLIPGRFLPQLSNFMSVGSFAVARCLYLLGL